MATEGRLCPALRHPSPSPRFDLVIHGGAPSGCCASSVGPAWMLFLDRSYAECFLPPKITINRPDRRNAFRPLTVKELMRAFSDARDDSSIGVVILTGKGSKAFCSGGDQALRDSDGYVDFDSFGRLNVLDLQVGSFDAGYGSSIMSRLVGPKKAREMWFLSRFYAAEEAERMGLVNVVVPLADLERETVKWCRQILRNSSTAIRVLKSALNAADDGHAGLQELGGNATLIFYGTEEAKEGKNAYMERRRPDFSKFPRKP